MRKQKEAALKPPLPELVSYWRQGSASFENRSDVYECFRSQPGDSIKVIGGNMLRVLEANAV